MVDYPRLIYERSLRVNGRTKEGAGRPKSLTSHSNARKEKPFFLGRLHSLVPAQLYMNVVLLIDDILLSS